MLVGGEKMDKGDGDGERWKGERGKERLQFWEDYGMTTLWVFSRYGFSFACCLFLCLPDSLLCFAFFALLSVSLGCGLFLQVWFFWFQA